MEEPGISWHEDAVELNGMFGIHEKYTEMKELGPSLSKSRSLDFGNQKQ